MVNNQCVRQLSGKINESDIIQIIIFSRVVKEVQQEVISMLGTAIAAKQSVNITEGRTGAKAEDSFGEEDENAFYTG